MGGTGKAFALPVEFLTHANRSAVACDFAPPLRDERARCNSSPPIHNLRLRRIIIRLSNRPPIQRRLQIDQLLSPRRLIRSSTDRNTAAQPERPDQHRRTQDRTNHVRCSFPKRNAPLRAKTIHPRQRFVTAPSFSILHLRLLRPLRAPGGDNLTPPARRRLPRPASSATPPGRSEATPARNSPAPPPSQYRPASRLRSPVSSAPARRFPRRPSDR